MKIKLDALKEILSNMGGFKMSAKSIVSNSNCAKIILAGDYDERVKMCHYQTMIRNIIAPDLYSEPDVPHMTLGYSVHSDKTKNMLLLPTTELHFGPPILCRFEDMTSYIPL